MYQHLRQVGIHKNANSFPFFQGTDPLLECMCPQVHDWPVRSMPVSWVWYKSSTGLACSYYVNFSNFTNTSGASWQTMTLVWQRNDNVFHFCSESSCHLRRFSLAISFGSLLSCVRFGDAHQKMLGFLIFLFLLLLHKPHLSSINMFCFLLLLFQAFKRGSARASRKNMRVFRGNFSTPPWNLARIISIIFPTIDFRFWGKTPWSRGFPDSGSSRFSWLSAPGTCPSATSASDRPSYEGKSGCPCLGKTVWLGIDVFRMKHVLVMFLLHPMHSLLNGCWMIAALKGVKPHRAQYYDVGSMHCDAGSLKLINLISTQFFSKCLVRNRCKPPLKYCHGNLVWAWTCLYLWTLVTLDGRLLKLILLPIAIWYRMLL